MKTVTKNEIPVPLSVVILARNEEQNIGRCVESVAWASDVIVVDDGSTDNTAILAEQSGARVIQHRFESFASQRNWAMQFGGALHEWVLHLDADEVATNQFKCEILRSIQNASENTDAFCICRKTMLDGQWLKYSDGFPVWIMRLVRNGRAWFKNNGHGEVAVPIHRSRISHITEPIYHFAFSKGLANWIDRHNRYSSREAQLEINEENEVKIADLATLDRAKRRKALRNFARRIPLRGPARFFYQYILKLGFLDGRAGWKFSKLMSAYESWISMKKAELTAIGTPVIRESRSFEETAVTAKTEQVTT